MILAINIQGQIIPTELGRDLVHGTPKSKVFRLRSQVEISDIADRMFTQVVKYLRIRDYQP